jgi:hypothetical protein
LPKPHLSGTVIYKDRDECAGNVTVTVTDPSGRERNAQTDAFGHFAFENVAIGRHSLRCDVEGYAPYGRKLNITGDITYLGEISLRPQG